MLYQRLFFPVYIFATAIVIYLTVPRPELKKYVQYALITGGLGDFFMAAFFQRVLGLVHYQNNWIFDFFGMNALSPVGWTATHVLFLYLLPRRKLLLYPYVGLFAVLSMTFGIVARNAGLFTFSPRFFYFVDPFIFLTWWGGAAWFFLTTNRNERD